VQRRRRADWREDRGRSAQEAAAWAARRAAVAVAAATLEARDGQTGDHSDAVALLCEAVAERLGMDEESTAYLVAAAKLHDIGKVAVPEQILAKPGPLDDEEWQAVRRHTITGERIISAVPELRTVASIVRSSHERYDGDGYPDGLAADEIPLASRIVFCADAFHAIRADRPYRRGVPATVALAEVRRRAGSQFDPVVAEALYDAAHELRLASTGEGGLRAFSASVRTRRLAALLLAFAVSGGALAATGNFPGQSEGSSPDSAREAPLVADAPQPTSSPRANTDAPAVRRAGAGALPAGERGADRAVRRRAARRRAARRALTRRRAVLSRRAARRRAARASRGAQRSGANPGAPGQPGSAGGKNAQKPASNNGVRARGNPPARPRKPRPTLPPQAKVPHGTPNGLLPKALRK
jgi:hypothetical protein